MRPPNGHEAGRETPGLLPTRRLHRKTPQELGLTQVLLSQTTAVVRLTLVI